MSYIEEIVDRVKKAASQVPRHVSVSLSQLLPEMSTESPPAAIQFDLDLGTTFGEEVVIKNILSNLHRTSQKLHPVGWMRMVVAWRKIFSPPAEDVQNPDFSILKELRMGLLLAASTAELASDLLKLTTDASNMLYSGVVELTHDVQAMLTCSTAIECFRNVNGPQGFTEKYHIPPLVHSIRLSSQPPDEGKLYGWVGFKDYIVINRDAVLPEGGIWTPISTMHAVSIIGHETQHGLLRMAYNSYNISTSDVAPSRGPGDFAESGYRWEKGMFRDLVIFWDQLLYPGTDNEMGNEVATDILAQVRRHNAFQLSDEQLKMLKASFKFSQNVGAVNGICYFRPSMVHVIR